MRANKRINLIQGVSFVKHEKHEIVREFFVEKSEYSHQILLGLGEFKKKKFLFNNFAVIL